MGVEHKLIQATWKSKSAMTEMLENAQDDGWSVAALGNVFGGTVLVMVRDGFTYQHKVVQLFWRLRGKLRNLIREQQDEGWVVCAIGECLGGAVVIFKKLVE